MSRFSSYRPIDTRTEFYALGEAFLSRIFLLSFTESIDENICAN